MDVRNRNPPHLSSMYLRNTDCSNRGTHTTCFTASKSHTMGQSWRSSDRLAKNLLLSSAWLWIFAEINTTNMDLHTRKIREVQTT
ncbi:hypothetical protein LINGRAHAP2_LOCUS31174 [Linum grandiflorum]